MNSSFSHNTSYHFNYTKTYRFICKHGTLISFQSLALWFHTKMVTYEPIVQSYHMSYHFNHIERYRFICNHVILISFQSQYSGFVSTKMVAYVSMIQSPYTSFQFHHAQPYLFYNSQFTIFKINYYLSIYQYQSLYYIHNQPILS